MELLQALDRFLAENVKGVSVDAQAVLAHVIRPPSYDGVSSDRGTEASRVPFKPVPPPALPVLSRCRRVRGRPGQCVERRRCRLRGATPSVRPILFTKASAIRQYEYGSELWSPDVQMHVASVSKLMTAMAMMVLFRDNNISPDAQIINYLPKYWAKGSDIEYITFRNLFNHTSGLSANYLVDFDMMKSAIAGGINLNDSGSTTIRI